MAITRITTWTLGQTLTAAALNGEMDGVYSKVGDITSTATVSGIWTFSANPIFNTGGITWAMVSKSGASFADITTGTVALANGGSGATTAGAARTAFGSTTVGDAVFIAASAAAARTAIGTVIGTDVQAYDADLTTLGALGSGARTALGLAIGTNVQAFSGILEGLSATIASADYFLVGGGSNWLSASPAVARAALGLVIGTNVQAYDATLAAVAASTYTGDNAIVTLGTVTTGNVDAVVSAASTTLAGKSELATTAETTTGTDTARTVTPDGLSGSIYGTKVVSVHAIDIATVVTTGDGKASYIVPVELNGMDLVSVGAHVFTVSSSGTPTIQIRNATQAADMLSTRITIDASEKDSSTAASAAVIDAANDDVATGDELYIDVDVAGTSTAGLQVRLGFRTP